MALYRVKVIDRHIIEGLIEADDFDAALKKSKDKFAYKMKKKSMETVYEEFVELNASSADKSDDIPVETSEN